MDCPRSGAVVFDKEQITSTSAVKWLTASKYNPPGANGRASFKADDALVQVQTQQIYYTLDGTDPSSSNGKVGYVGSIICLSGYQHIQNFRFTRVSADGKLDVEYFR